MKNKKTLKKTCLITGLLFVSFLLVLSNFLSKTERVKANVLAVEGWLWYYDLNFVYNEFKQNDYDYIVVTGLKSSFDFCNVFTEGFLIFYPKSKIISNQGITNNTIEVLAYSELDKENSAHFNLYVNDSIIADFYAGKHPKKYSSTWYGDISDIDSILIEFTNDKVGVFGDRNLFVKEIVINNKFVIPMHHNSEYVIGKIDSKQRLINDKDSNSDIVRDTLVLMGIDTSKVIAISGEKTSFNRTLSSVIAFRDWLNKNEMKVTGINVISANTHSRRTWMTFRKVLNKSYDIGIISLTDYKKEYPPIRKIIKLLRESIAIIYYWIILIPY